MLLKYKFQNMMITLKSFGAFANSRSVMGIPKLQRYPHLTEWGQDITQENIYETHACLKMIASFLLHQINAIYQCLPSFNLIYVT